MAVYICHPSPKEAGIGIFLTSPGATDFVREILTQNKGGGGQKEDPWPSSGHANNAKTEKTNKKKYNKQPDNHLNNDANLLLNISNKKTLNIPYVELALHGASGPCQQNQVWTHPLMEL